MADFLRQLEELLSTAEGDGLIASADAKKLLKLAHDRDGHQRTFGLATLISVLGGVALILGVVLLVSANWDEIAGWFKIACLLVLLAGSHTAGFWLSWRNPQLAKTAEALHLVGAGLFLAGVGLVSQVYHVNSYPPDGVLWWLAAIVPLAILLRSPPISVMAVFALLLWGHMEGSESASPLGMPNVFIAQLALEIGLGMALLGFGAALRRVEPAIGATLRGCGVVLLIGSLYLAGFYKEFTYIASSGSLTLPVGALALGALGLGVGFRRFAPEALALQAALVALLASLLAWCGFALAADVGSLPRGPMLEFPGFGWQSNYSATAWMLSLAAWGLWFALAFWAMAYGARAGRMGYLNCGALAVGLGMLTRFFDLLGTLTFTGLAFVIGGVLLVVTGLLIERWRRRLIARWQRSGT